MAIGLARRGGGDALETLVRGSRECLQFFAKAPAAGGATRVGAKGDTWNTTTKPIGARVSHGDVKAGATTSEAERFRKAVQRFGTLLHDP